MNHVECRRRQSPACLRPARLLVILPMILALLLPATMPACGPYFPNMLLSGGDAPLLVAPVASFLKELERLNLGVPMFRARLPENSHRAQTGDADLADLRTALEQGAVSAARREFLISQYQSARAALARQAEAVEAWRQQIPMNQARGLTNPPPSFTAPAMVEGLPGEFADYLRGAIAWHGGRTNDARLAWQALLKRPALERRFKSTWAAFMLGKSWEEAEPDKAVSAFRNVRALAKAGFADSLGLASSSLGWEARIEYQRKRHEPAIELYLDHLASGDPSAVVSLRWAASAALTDRNAPLKRLAANVRCRRVLTAWLLSGGNRIGPIDMDGPTKEAMLQLLAKAPWIGGRAASLHSMEYPGLLWLEAVESAGIRDAEAAEQFALSAYQCGEADLARRWIERAKDSPLARWLRAKLLLREGKLDDAAALLAQVSRSFPVEPPRTNGPSGGLFHSLRIEDDRDDSGVSVPQQVLGELGALRLARREFTEALDCLLRAGFWMDAAYVAERVLTIEELKTYVDRHWPVGGADPAYPGKSFFPAELHPSAPILLEVLIPAGKIRHLLGRRLTRAQRGAEARAYFPTGILPALETFLSGMTVGTNLALPAAQRASALWSAAQLARGLGMEILGTEVEPDWAVHGGSFEEGPAIATRMTTGSVIRATSKELRRARLHAPESEQRFHYRYTAAALAWQAAKLMPDNSDETARVLCQAGSWLKGIEPKAADVFYKALVRRCRKTTLGDAADRLRWFPRLDEAGNLMAPEKKTAE